MLLKSEKGNETTTTSPFTSPPMPRLPQDAASPFFKEDSLASAVPEIICCLSSFSPGKIKDLKVMLAWHLVQFPDDLF
ncbi:hypothetical protein, partial [Methanoregula sp.]|uniref:hypothetical protein n=1 Tax=Methanoregula sp. TaxID=2052170 RepID=UPI0025D41D56